MESTIAGECHKVILSPVRSTSFARDKTPVPLEESQAGDIPEEGFGERLFERDAVTEGDEIDFDVTGLPPTWDDGDGLDQTTLTNTILAQFACDETIDQRYDHIAEESKPLSDFRKMYEHGRERLVREQALRMLKKKIRVTIPGSMKYERDHKDIVYSDVGVSGDLCRTRMAVDCRGRCILTSVKCLAIVLVLTRCSRTCQIRRRVTTLSGPSS